MATAKLRLGRGLDSLLPKTQILPIMPAATTENSREIAINDIEVNPYQARKNFSPVELEKLAQSIKNYGIIEPLVVARKGEGRYLLIAGERRWRAAKIAGLNQIPVVIRDVDNKNLALLGLIENIERQDLNALELAQSLRRLASEFHWTHEEMASRLGFSRSRVSNLLRILDLESDIQEYLAEGHLSETQARALLSIDDRAQRLSFARSIAIEQKKISVRDLEQSSRSKTKRRDPDIVDLEEKLSRLLKTRVRITHNPRTKSGWISIEYATLEQFEELSKHIEGNTNH